MVNLNYLINFTDDSLKEPFVLPPKSKNETLLSIVLYGYGSAGWGERLQENSIRILENFASEIPPKNPTIGQLWYDNYSKVIKVWDGTKWKSAASSQGPDLPRDPVIGDLWYDTSVNLLKYWDGKQWQAITATASIDPPDSPYLGMLWFDITKNKLFFWDGNAWCKIENDLEEELDAKVDTAGDTMTGFLSLHADPTSAMHAVTKQYVDINFVDTAGDAMTGYLTLFADPITPLHAATKKFVDDTATSIHQYIQNNFSSVNSSALKNGDIKVVGSTIYIYASGVWRQVFPAVYS